MNIDNIKQETVSNYIKDSYNACRDYNNRIKNLTNKFFKDNHIPLKVGDRVMVVDGKIGTIKQLHVEHYKYVLRYNYIPMVQVVLDENRDLEYFASLTNIKKI